MRAPMTGSATATESMPAPPIKPMSKAPPRGYCCEVTPSIVGQRKALPMPNTVAAANAIALPLPACRPPSQ